MILKIPDSRKYNFEERPKYVYKKSRNLTLKSIYELYKEKRALKVDLETFENICADFNLDLVKKMSTRAYHFDLVPYLGHFVVRGIKIKRPVIDFVHFNKTGEKIPLESGEKEEGILYTMTWWKPRSGLHKFYTMTLLKTSKKVIRDAINDNTILTLEKFKIQRNLLKKRNKFDNDL